MGLRGVWVVTAHECAGTVERVCYVLLHKPVDPMTLRATIDRFLKTYAEPDRTRVSTTL